MNETTDPIGSLITCLACLVPLILIIVATGKRRAAKSQEPLPTAPAPTPSPTAKRREFYTKVVGVTQGNRQTVIAKLRVGQAVELRPEPTNPVDPHAIAVYVKGKQIGYVSAELAEENARDGWVGKCTAVVSDVTGGKRGKETRGVNLKIML